MDVCTQKEIIDFLKNKVHKSKVLVIGDVMLDRYFYGSVNRISPEAPVPVNCIETKKDTLGGAANVAHNLARLGCQTYLVGVVGDDHHGRLLVKELKKRSIHVDGVIVNQKRTTTKVRVLGGHQQMMRLDFEETDNVEPLVEEKINSVVNHYLDKGIDAIIISDYGKGVCTNAICQHVIRKAKEKSVVVLADPKGNKWEKYYGVNYITPNVKETGEIIGHELINKTDVLREAANNIRHQYAVEYVMITRSEKGISIFGDKEITMPTVAQEVFDVSGAGDTVIAVFAVAVGMKINISAAIELANLAAGIEVGKIGTYAVCKEEILTAIKCSNDND